MSYTNGLDKPSDYFNTNLYVGNGSDGHAITGVGFQSNLTWLKNRDDTNAHQLFDSVRGATKTLFVNETSAEATYANTLQSFDSDGFTVGTSSGANTNANNFVSWNWLASNTTASNTAGSITSTVSANTTSGFSIVKYTGTGSNATVGHGLGAIPKIVIIKNRDRVSGWHVGGDAIGSVNQYLNLNDTAAIDSASTGFRSFSSTTFGIGTDTDWNASGESIIAYCFAEKKGFSKAFSYTGNGSSDGTFVYTGMRPAFVMIKKSSATENWAIYDNKRNPFNLTNLILNPNLSQAEATGVTGVMDIVSNGFKIRGTSDALNGSGGTYIGIAFAEHPFVTSTSIPTTAR
jgi:hypothetical protein